MTERFKQYFELTGGRPPHTHTVHGFEIFKDNHDPTGLPALDFGCGAGRDTRFLLEQGMAVTAVDADTSGMAQLEGSDNLEIVRSTFDEFAFAEYAFISSQYALSFNPPETFRRMFRELVSSLRTGGILTCNIFGKNDEWTFDPTKTFLDEQEMLELLAGLEVLELSEVEYDGKLPAGTPKHWHYFELSLVKSEPRAIDRTVVYLL